MIPRSRRWWSRCSPPRESGAQLQHPRRRQRRTSTARRRRGDVLDVRALSGERLDLRAHRARRHHARRHGARRPRGAAREHGPVPASSSSPHFGAAGTTSLSAGLDRRRHGRGRALRARRARPTGSVRDHVLGVTMLSGTRRADALRRPASSRTSRATTSRGCIAGSMGILGVIVEVSLKVLPKAPMPTSTLRFDLDQPRRRSRSLQRRGARQPLPLEREPRGGTTTSIVRLRGSAAAVRGSARARSVARAIAADVRPAPFWHEPARITPIEFFVDRAVRRRAAGDATLWRLSLPSDRSAARDPGPGRRAELIEWHGAQRWLLQRRYRQRTVRDAARQRCTRPRDALSLARQARRRCVRAAVEADRCTASTSELKKLVRSEAGILNPGRLYPGL